MRCIRRLVAAIGLVGISVVCLVAAGTPAFAGTARDADPARTMTMQLGRGLGPYRIGMRRVVQEDLLRTVRQRENDGPGCSGGFVQDSFVDVYPGLRLGYGFDGDRTYLDTIATTRRGDRTSLGYAIGTATLTDVRKRYPRLKLRRHLGGTTLSIFHRTGYESGAHLEYGFDSAGRLVRLQTGVGGC
jgi:hypothetical protein